MEPYRPHSPISLSRAHAERHKYMHNLHFVGMDEIQNKGLHQRTTFMITFSSHHSFQNTHTFLVNTMIRIEFITSHRGFGTLLHLKPGQ